MREVFRSAAARRHRSRTRRSVYPENPIRARVRRSEPPAIAAGRLGPGWRTRQQNRLTVIVIGSIVAVTMQQPIKVMLMLNFVRMTMFLPVPVPVTVPMPVTVPVLGDDLGMILSRLQHLRRMRDARHHRPKDQ